MPKPLGRIFPKNLDVMREKIAANPERYETPDNHNCRELIDQCAAAEESMQAVDGLLTTAQAAKRLGVSEQTLRNWEETGQLIPSSKTPKGHRRYKESQITPLVKKQLGATEIVLPGIHTKKLRDLFETLMSNFGDERISLIISQGVVDCKVRITIDSEDGLTTICKTFNIED